MKSADVAGKAIPPRACHTQADAAPGPGRAERGDPAAAAGRVGTAAAALRRASMRSPDRLAREMAQDSRASLLRPERVRAFVVEVPARHVATVAGYAPARPTAVSAQASGAARSSGASTSSGGQWAFLDDPKLSIEDKLFMFMKLVMKKSDDELQQKMKEYQAGKAAKAGGSSSSGAEKSSGGLFGILKKVFPPLGALEKVIPALPDLVNKVATQFGPQLMGALMIPLGAPWAAPLVQKAASALLPAALSAIDGATGAASGSASGSTGTSGSSGAAKDENDERMQLLEIERMMQKTNQMFATISNILKATHDAAMTAVNNIR